MPAKQRNAIKIEFRWPADSGIWNLPSLINYKKVVKVGPPLAKLSGSAHVYSQLKDKKEV